MFLLYVTKYNQVHVRRKYNLLFSLCHPFISFRIRYDTRLSNLTINKLDKRVLCNVLCLGQLVVCVKHFLLLTVMESFNTFQHHTGCVSPQTGDHRMWLNTSCRVDAQVCATRFDGCNQKATFSSISYLFLKRHLTTQ